MDLQVRSFSICNILFECQIHHPKLFAGPGADCRRPERRNAAGSGAVQVQLLIADSFCLIEVHLLVL